MHTGLATRIAIGAAVLLLATRAHALVWEAIPTPASLGERRAVAAMTATSRSIVVSVRGEGVYRSADDGATWIQADPVVTGDSVISLLAADGVILAGRDEGEVLRSADGGATWQPLAGSPTGIPRLRQIGRAIYAVGGHVWSTRDLGDSWRVEYVPTHYMTARDVDIHAGSLVVGSDSGVSREGVAGGNWTRSAAAMGLGELARVRTVLYAGPGWNLQTQTYGLHRSTDGGMSWSSAGADSVGLAFDALMAHGSALYVASREGRGETSGGVRVSRDGGETWTREKGPGAPAEADRLYLIGEDLYAHSSTGLAQDNSLFRAHLGPPAFAPQLTVVQPVAGARLRGDGSDTVVVRMHNHSGGWRWRLHSAVAAPGESWKPGSEDGTARLGPLPPGADYAFEVELVDRVGDPLSPPVARRVETRVALGGAIAATDTRIAFVSDRSGDRDIYTVAPDGTRLMNLTQHRAEDHEPAWSPDGLRIAFVSDRDGTEALYAMDADGSNIERLTAGGSNLTHVRWSPSGSQIAFLSRAQAYDPTRISLLDVVTGTRSELGSGFGFAWSPDATRIALAYSRRPDGLRGSGVAVARLDGSRPAVIWEQGIGPAASPYIFTPPVWLRDGSRVLFVSYSLTFHGKVIYAKGFAVSPDGLRIAEWAGGAPVAVSPDGALVITRSRSRERLFDTFNTTSADGMWHASLGFTHGTRIPSWAPDSSAIAREDIRDIYILTPDGRMRTRLTWEGGGQPAWQPFPDRSVVTDVTTRQTPEDGLALPQGISLLRVNAPLDSLSAGGWEAAANEESITAASLIALGATLCLPHPNEGAAGVVGERGVVLHGQDFPLAAPGEYIVNFPQAVTLNAPNAGLSAPALGAGPRLSDGAPAPWAFVVVPKRRGDAHLPEGARFTIVSSASGAQARVDAAAQPTPVSLVDARQRPVVRLGSSVRVAVSTADGYGLGPVTEYAVTEADIARAFAVVEVTPSTTGTRPLPNYPNPFNPETWLPFELFDAADVAITIYDARGRVVRTLSLGRRPAGFHVTRRDAAHWDGRNERGEAVSSGVYYYEWVAGETRRVRRMVVAR